MTSAASLLFSLNETVIALTERKELVTKQPVTVKYQDLGDFGGTQRTSNNYVLSVHGAPMEWNPKLKRMGLRWNSGAKTWEYSVSVPAFGHTQKTAAHKALVDKAHAVLKKMADDHNEEVRKHNEGLKQTPKDMRERMRKIDHELRRNNWLSSLGLDVEVEWPKKWGPAAEPIVHLKGKGTFAAKEVLKKHGFSFNGTKKSWFLPYREWSLVATKVATALAKEFKEDAGLPEFLDLMEELGVVVCQPQGDPWKPPQIPQNSPVITGGDLDEANTDALWKKLHKEFPDVPLGDLKDTATSVSPRMSATGKKIQKRYLTLKKQMKVEHWLHKLDELLAPFAEIGKGAHEEAKQLAQQIDQLQKTPFEEARKQHRGGGQDLKNKIKKIRGIVRKLQDLVKDDPSLAPLLLSTQKKLRKVIDQIEIGELRKL
jgi:ElaB/YqjD/DUF883 family membrane-anchored ribosome-binding protein